MITSPNIRAAERALSELRAFDSNSEEPQVSQEDVLASLLVGPISVRNYIDRAVAAFQSGGDMVEFATTIYLTGVFSERYAVALSNMEISPDELAEIAGESDETDHLSDLRDLLRGVGIEYSDDTSLQELETMVATHMFELVGLDPTEIESALKELFADSDESDDDGEESPEAETPEIA